MSEEESDIEVAEQPPEQPLEPGVEQYFDETRRGVWPSGDPNKPSLVGKILAKLQHPVDNRVYYHMRDPSGEEYYAPAEEVEEVSLQPGVERPFSEAKKGILANGMPQGQENTEADVVGELLSPNGQIYYHMSHPIYGKYYAPINEVQLTEEPELEPETPPAPGEEALQLGVVRDFSEPKWGIMIGTESIGSDPPEFKILGETLGKDNKEYYRIIRNINGKHEVHYVKKSAVQIVGESPLEAFNGTREPERPSQPFRLFWETTKARFNQIEPKQKRVAAKAGAWAAVFFFGGISIPATAVLRVGLARDDARMRKYEEELARRSANTQ